MAGTTTHRSVQLESDSVEIELEVYWASPARDKLVLSGTANGPSWWNLERLEERILVAWPEEDATDEDLR